MLNNQLRRGSIILLLAITGSVCGQDLLSDNPTFSGLTLDLVEYVRLPQSHRKILSMSSPRDDDRLFVSADSGRIYSIEQNAAQGHNPVLWFDVGQASAAATGRDLNFLNGGQGGLRSFALHPDFETNGKLYVSIMQDRPPNPSQFNYLGNSTSTVAVDSVVAEFTYDQASSQFVDDSYRELFRVNLPVNDHQIKQMKFNQFANPGDDDYGLLYVVHGDAGPQSAQTGGGQNRDNALGKVLRFNPLASGEMPYTTPHSPFADDPQTLDEIFASGFRNPHNLSFAESADGAKLIVADIGRDNIEEVNIVAAGANHGWSQREGTFVQLARGGFLDGVAELPADEANLGFTYPAAQFDHKSGDGPVFSSIAIAGGHAIANGSELDGNYIFGDFAASGHFYHASFEDMLGAVTTLDPDDLSRDEPTELSQATISRLQVRFDHDKDPGTAPQEFDTFNELLGTGRSDMRFGEGANGELYISSKQNGRVYLVTNSLPSFDGDFNGDLSVDAQDIDLLWGSVNAGGGDLQFDLTENGNVDAGDVEFLVGSLLGSKSGDTNLDGRVEFDDFLVLSGNFGSTGGWASGDFDGDGQIAFGDFLQLSRNFDSLSQNVEAVPEPSTNHLLLMLVLCFPLTRRCFG